MRDAVGHEQVPRAKLGLRREAHDAARRAGGGILFSLSCCIPYAGALRRCCWGARLALNQSQNGSPMSPRRFYSVLN